jgi:hypothetical protein
MDPIAAGLTILLFATIIPALLVSLTLKRWLGILDRS